MKADADAARLCVYAKRLLQVSFCFRPPHPFLPYVAPHFSHISHFILSGELLERMLSGMAEMKKGGWWEPPRINPKKSVGTEFVKEILKFNLKKLVVGA